MLIAAPAIVLDSASDPDRFWILLLLAGGIAGGLLLLGRGLRAIRTGDRVSGIAPSRIASIAAGEVLVTGVAEAIELTLVSPLQSAPCLYYRARVASSGDSDTDLFREERAVGFRVRDDSGAVRIFPRGARFDVPDRFDAKAGTWDGDPPGLLLRTGPVFGPGPDRDAQIAALLTVRDPAADPRDGLAAGGPGLGIGGGSWLLGGTHGGSRRYTEARIDPGDAVTVIGRVLTFGDLADPAAANLLDGSMVGADDPEVAADLAAARATGRLADTPEAAWGNAAIEGFGIGRPTRSPDLDPRATPPPPPDPTVSTRARAAFDIAPDALVLADATDSHLFVSLGAPAAVTARAQGSLLVGLLGAVVAIAAAMALAILVTGPS